MTRSFALVLLAGVLVIGAGIGLREPWPADEPVYALIARDMLAHGNWLLPMVGGDYFQDKPPLFFWLTAAAFRLTGSERVGFLLPSLLAGVGTVALLYDLVRRLWNRDAAVVASVALLCTVQFVLQARRAQLDAVLVFFTFLAVYALMRQLLLEGGWRWAAVAGAAAALGMLTKVVGFLAFLVLVPWLFAVWREWPGVRWIRPWYGWGLAGLAGAAVLAIWLVPLLAAAAGDPEIARYRDELLIEQTVGRYADPWHHFKPPWYYLLVMLTLWLPLTLLLPWLVPAWVRALKARDARVLLPLAFVVLYVGLFSVSSGKRDVYILSALPVLVLAAAGPLPALLRTRAVQATLLGLLIVLGVVTGGAWAWFHWWSPDQGAAVLADGDVDSAAPLAVLSLLALLLAAVCRFERAALGVALFLGGAWSLGGWWVQPQMDARRSAEAFVTRLEELADPARELGLAEYRESFLWHLRRPTVNFGHRRFREGEQEIHDAAAWLAADPSRQLLIGGSHLEACFANASRRPVGQVSSTEWYLVSGTPEPACAARGRLDAARTYVPARPAVAEAGR